MKNAHERFGFAEFEKQLKDTTTRIRLTADCFIGEQPESAALPSATCFRFSAPTLRWQPSGLQSSVKSRSRSADRILYRVGLTLANGPAVYRGTSNRTGGEGAQFDTWWWRPRSSVLKATKPGSS